MINNREDWNFRKIQLSGGKWERRFDRVQAKITSFVEARSVYQGPEGALHRWRKVCPRIST